MTAGVQVLAAEIKRPNQVTGANRRSGGSGGS